MNSDAILCQAMSTTVTVGSTTLSSNTGESAQDMIATLQPQKEETHEGKVIEENGKPVEEVSEESKAASLLGKKGGEAAAEARAKAAKEKGKAEEPEEDDVAEAEAAEKEGKLGKPRHDPRARMLEKAREAKALKAERDQERTKRETLERELSAERARKAEPKPEPRRVAAEDPDPEPKEEEFEDYKEFVKATGRWSARQEFQKQEQAAENRRQAHAFAESVGRRAGQFRSRLEAADKAEPGWRDGIAPEIVALRTSSQLAPHEQVGTHNVIADAIVDSEHPRALMQHFTAHKDEFQRIATLQTPPEIWREMARLEARLEGGSAGSDAANAGASALPEISKARPSGRPVPVSPHADSAGLDDDAPLSAYVSDWGKRELSSRR